MSDIMYQYVLLGVNVHNSTPRTLAYALNRRFHVKEFYRVHEVMEILNIGRTKTYDLIRAGVIPSVDMNGSRRSKRVPVKLLHEKIETIISTCKRNESASAQPSATGDSAARHRLPSKRGSK
jgi:excisionase family DNA binding protein